MMENKEHKQALLSQIEQLQQRQIAEFEALKNQIDNSKDFEAQLEAETKPLVEEIARLRQLLRSLEAEKQQQTTQLEHLHTQMQSAMGLVKNAIRGSQSIPDTALRDSILEHAEKLETTAQPYVSASLPAVSSPAQPPALTKKKETQVAVATKTKVPAKLAHLSRRLVRFSIIVAILGGTGYVGVTRFISTSTGQVAGISTDRSVTTSPTATPESVADDYAESFAELPFNETEWDKMSDSEFGMSIDYPMNTSNRIHTIGSNNVWFLRKSGYLMKITRLETEQNLEQWFDTNKDNYTEDYTISKSTFKNTPAFLAQPRTHTDNSGYQYIVKKDKQIFQIWVKDEPPTTDDGQRIARMVTSLQFTK